jgi:putative cardiolipin synthase
MLVAPGAHACHSDLFAWRGFPQSPVPGVGDRPIASIAHSPYTPRVPPSWRSSTRHKADLNTTIARASCLPSSPRNEWLRCAAALVAALLLSACASQPFDRPKTESTALTDTDDTPLAKTVAASRPKDADDTQSGLQLVARGEEAYGNLYTLIHHAQRSLDLQYYIVKDDPEARTLLRTAREAAERGVRVRILLDDFYTSGKDERIAWYSAHPNIEVRLFNPFLHGRDFFATRLIESVADLDRVNRRMHNKLFVADNAIAQTGGRNVGDEYYAFSSQTNFLDLDVLVGGPIVHELSETFDRYWNSPFAVPIEALTKSVAADAATTDQKALSDPNDPVLRATTEAIDLGQELDRELNAGKLPLIWAPTELLADKPSKIHRTAPEVDKKAGLIGGQTIATDLLSIIARAHEELIIISPYFVPGERGVAALRALRERGVRVRVLTNSLAATDAAAVHIGYSKYRKPLLEAGVEISELRPDRGSETARLSAIGSSKASLHAKAIVIDRKSVFIGSFNVDQRSALENTEMGLHIESPELCQEVIGVLRDRGPETRYQVTLDDNHDLVWTTTTDGVEQVFHDEPGAGTFLKWSLKLLAPFAPEQML